jgi:hypothetical protein
VDDGLGWASFTSKYPRLGPTGLMRSFCRRSTPQGATQTGWMISATTHEGSTSVDVGAIRERLLPGVSHVASCVVSDNRYVADAIAGSVALRRAKALVPMSMDQHPDRLRARHGRRTGRSKEVVQPRSAGRFRLVTLTPQSFHFEDDGAIPKLAPTGARLLRRTGGD